MSIFCFDLKHLVNLLKKITVFLQNSMCLKERTGLKDMLSHAIHTKLCMKATARERDIVVSISDVTPTDSSDAYNTQK